MGDPSRNWIQRAWARIRGEVEEKAPRPADLMHWSPDHTSLPLCGARLGGLWTYEYKVTTCERCRELGLPIVMQYEANTR